METETYTRRQHANYFHTLHAVKSYLITNINVDSCTEFKGWCLSLSSGVQVISDIVTHCICTPTMHSELSVTCSCYKQLAEQWMEPSQTMPLTVDTWSLRWEQNTKFQGHTVGIKWILWPFHSSYQPLVTGTGHELHIHIMHHLTRLQCDNHLMSSHLSWPNYI